MAIQTTRQREALAVAYGNSATHGALYTTAPGASAGSEPSGGSPAYARKALTWLAGTVDGQVSATAVFDVPAGATIVGAGLHASDGGYLDGDPLDEPQEYNYQGTMTFTFNYVQE